MTIIAEVVEEFFDKVENIQRSVGDVFETSEERFEVFAGANSYGRAFAVEAEKPPVVEAKELTDYTVAELKEMLDEKGLEYGKKASKADLIALLS